MKNIIIKKVIPIISVFVIIVSIFCFNVGAITSIDEIPQNLTWVNLTPGSAFAWFDYVDGFLRKEDDTQANAQFNENDLIYYFNFGRDDVLINNQMNNVFFNINVAGNGYELKPGINYYFKMKLIIPTAYVPEGTSSFRWKANDFSAGGFSWASVSYTNRNQYNFQLSSPQFTEYVALNPDDLWVEYNIFEKYPYLVNGSKVQLSYVDVIGTVNRSTAMNLKSIGFQMPIDNAWGWHGWMGVGGFQIGVPSQYAPLPGGTPDYNTGNSDNMHNLENSINNQNQSNIEASTNLFNSFNGILDTNSSLIKGLAGVTYIFNHLFMKVPWIQNLLTFSLTLGLIAFLLGSGVSIYTSHVNKGIRRERRNEAAAKTEAYRKARLEAIRRRKS